MAGVVAALCLLLSPNGALAIWAELSETELIEQSKLIVTGQLIGRTQIASATDGDEVHLGVIQVESVHKGDPGQEVVLLVLPTPTPGIHSSGVITYTRGQRGLWYLRSANAPGLFLADHPQRFVPIESAAAAIRALEAFLSKGPEK